GFGTGTWRRRSNKSELVVRREAGVHEGGKPVRSGHALMAKVLDSKTVLHKGRAGALARPGSPSASSDRHRRLHELVQEIFTGPKISVTTAITHSSAIGTPKPAVDIVGNLFKNRLGSSPGLVGAELRVPVLLLLRGRGQSGDGSHTATLHGDTVLRRSDSLLTAHSGVAYVVHTYASMSPRDAASNVFFCD
ncbi:hypothetical protein GW17_00001826, partial [Ensete ventricosum]